MSLLGDIAEGLATSFLNDSQQAQGWQSVVSDLLNQSGGLQSLVQQFQGKGLGDIISSWVGTGQNLPVDGNQLKNVFGTEVINAISGKLGLDSSQTLGNLAALLPGLIDKLTPNGQIPERIDLSQAFADLFRKS